MFVAASLGTRLLNNETDPVVQAFITPTIVYFALILLLASLMNIPNQTQVSLAAQLAALGGAGTGYTLSNLHHLRGFHRDGKLSRQNWYWYLVLPLFGNVCLAGAAFLLKFCIAPALDVAAVGVLVLVSVGLHNAWETTLYYVSRTSSF